MYKVILQQKNRLINKLFNTNKAMQNGNLLFMDNLLKVLSISFDRNITRDEVEIEIKGSPYTQYGQFMIHNPKILLLLLWELNLLNQINRHVK